MTPDRLQKLRELNEARTWGDIEGSSQPKKEMVEFMSNNADWLIGCVEALEFYASRDNWYRNHQIKEFVINRDGGERARQALAAKET